MLHDRLAQELYSEICQIPLIDSHTHINPREPAARSLEDILGYHYYTELAHSAGMDKAALTSRVDPRHALRELLNHASRFDNTVQYAWLVEIARAFFNFQGERLSPADSAWLCDSAERVMSAPDWERQVLALSNIEKVFLTNDFDDSLEGFDTDRYVPCLRTDDLVFRLHDPEVRRRLTAATGVAPSDAANVRRAQARFSSDSRLEAPERALSPCRPTFPLSRLPTVSFLDPSARPCRRTGSSRVTRPQGPRVRLSQREFFGRWQKPAGTSGSRSIS